MASNKNNSNSNRLVVPEAQEAMNKFKMEAANEVGVNIRKNLRISSRSFVEEQSSLNMLAS